MAKPGEAPTPDKFCITCGVMIYGKESPAECAECAERTAAYEEWARFPAYPDPDNRVGYGYYLAGPYFID